ncbi:MAG: type II toxin-antitoxin system VapC family toxin [Chloroflexota bacterium]
MSALTYADASALVKLVLAEPESPALHRWFVEAQRIVTSRVGVVETIRACARRGDNPAHRDRVLERIDVFELDASIAGIASTLEPPARRTLDAIHLATAFALLPDLDAFLTYDDRLADAARSIGLPVVRPA